MSTPAPKPTPAPQPAKKGKKKEEEEVSEEDQALIEQMALLVERAADTQLGIRRNALTAMSKEIREATSSMTSVPKPLKFLRPHYGTLKEHHANEKEDEVRGQRGDRKAAGARGRGMKGRGGG
eukprot:scaffold33028_cov32-Tisochrysis_lutea.AAC.6